MIEEYLQGNKQWVVSKSMETKINVEAALPRSMKSSHILLKTTFRNIFEDFYYLFRDIP